MLSALAIVCFQLAHLVGVDRGYASFVDAGRLGLGDPLQLSLAAKVGLELGKHPEHVEEAFAGGRAGIDRLFCRSQ
jgi:hypothetical protein